MEKSGIQKPSVVALSDEQKALQAVQEELRKVAVGYDKAGQQSIAALDPVSQAMETLKAKIQDTGKGFVSYGQAT